MAMKYCKTLTIILISIFFSLIFSSGCSRDAEYKTIDGFTQGTTFHIVYSPDTQDSLYGFVNEILNNIDNSLSVYNDSSVISKLNRGENVVMDLFFINVLTDQKKFIK